MSEGKTLTQQRLHELLSYDPSTGAFARKVSVKGCRPGVAGSDCLNGYKSIRVDGRAYFLHRLAWMHVYGAFPNGEIDHINGDRSDNRIANLRVATRSQNNQNKRRPLKNNKTGFLGVSFRPREGVYRAAIKLNGKQKHLGYYKTAEDASKAYLNAKRIMHPFSNL